MPKKTENAKETTKGESEVFVHMYSAAWAVAAVLSVIFFATALVVLVDASAASVTPSNSTINVSVCVGETISVVIYANASQVPQPHLDIYLSPSTNYGSTKYMYNFYLPTGNNYLKPALDSALSGNPRIRYGAGTYSTKRNIGWPNDRDFQHWVNMTNSTDAIMAAITPIFGDPDNPYVLDVEAVDQTSFLDAFLNVLQFHATYGVGHYTERVFFTITNLPYAQQGDVWPNMNSPDSHFPVAFDSESNVITSFPLNDLDGVLQSDCVLYGMVCSEIWGLQRMIGGDIACNMPLQRGFIDILNVTQFAPGSCEDFPNATQIIPIAQDKKFDLWVMMQYDPFSQAGIDQDALDAYTELVTSISPGSRVIPPDADLSVLFPQLTNAYWTTEVTVIQGGSSLANITDLPCNGTAGVCEVVVDIVYGDEYNQTIVLNVTGVGFVTIEVSKCSETPSATAAPSVHPSGKGTDLGASGVVLLIVGVIVIIFVMLAALYPSWNDDDNNSNDYNYNYVRLVDKRTNARYNE